jgi:hypothetical protein
LRRELHGLVARATVRLAPRITGGTPVPPDLMLVGASGGVDNIDIDRALRAPGAAPAWRIGVA